MALFKSNEEKQNEQEQKEIKMLQKYGLENLSNPADRESVRKIVSELLGTGMMETGMKLQLAKAEVALPVYYQRAILEQNFIMIRQLDRIAQLLEK